MNERQEYNPSEPDVPLDDVFERVTRPLNEFVDFMAQAEAVRDRELHLHYGPDENPLGIGTKEITSL